MNPDEVVVHVVKRDHGDVIFNLFRNTFVNLVNRLICALMLMAMAVTVAIQSVHTLSEVCGMLGASTI